MTIYLKCQSCNKLLNESNVHSILLTSKKRDGEWHTEFGWTLIALYEYMTRKTRYWCIDCIAKHNKMATKLPKNDKRRK
jgi:hypothetical protein